MNNHNANQGNNEQVTLSPFHSGEQELQTRVGKREKMENFGIKAVRPFMPNQHREFFAQLPFLLVGSVDNEGWPWASILPGEKGFIKSPTATTLDIKSAAILGDPLADALNTQNSPLGLLGIELNTRRRNRLNGRVNTSPENGIVVSVDQSFGNCPQYIQHRSVEYIRNAGEVGEHYDKQTFTSLDEKATSLIQNSDTFFVSSFVQIKDRPEIEGVDVSHRGGRPGFVKVTGNTLTIPDYPGNNIFNTLGNFLINPRGGLIFTDFTSGEILMLTGKVELLWDTTADIQAFKGAERAWKFTLHHGVRLLDALPFRATLGDYSPNSLMTGTWDEAIAIQSAKIKKDTWRPFTVSEIRDESNEVRSFFLTPNDDQAILPFEAGQYLTIKVNPSSSPESLTRFYTVSSEPNKPYYRISVKKEKNGEVSQYLHNHLKKNNVINVKAPRGSFYIDPLEKRPAVLIAGGVGVTPMISMAQHVYKEGIRMRQLRPLTIIHASKTSNSRAFFADFKKLETLSSGKVRYISFLSVPKASEKLGIDFHGSGRLDKNTYQQFLSLDDYDFYLCGPNEFMQSQYDALIELGVNDNRIFTEAFGPASLQRRQAIQNTPPERTQEASESVIRFSKSKFEQLWTEGDKSLLETAEDHGLTPEFSCRNGSCGACATKLISGEVTYRNKPSVNVNEDKVLICCAVPAKDSTLIELDL